MRKKTLCTLIVSSFFLMPFDGFANQKNVCESFVPAAVGGPVSEDRSVLSIRWLGAANLELTYNGQVILFNTFFDRGPDYPPLAFPLEGDNLRPDRLSIWNNTIINADQVVRADAVFLPSGGPDHMPDAAQVAIQTGANVFAMTHTIQTLKDNGLDESQIFEVDVYNGDFYAFDGFTAEIVPEFHSSDGGYDQTPSDISQAVRDFKDAIKALVPAPSTEQAAWNYEMWRTKSKWNAGDDHFALLLTFGHDFRVMLYCSANRNLAPEMGALIEQIGGSTDVGSVAYAGGPELYSIANSIMPAIKLFNSKYFIPNHHDDMDVTPLFDAIHDEVPGTTPIFLAHKQAACFNVNSHKRIYPEEMKNWGKKKGHGNKR